MDFILFVVFRSCLSEYVRVDTERRSVLLCHSNVTVPVQIGDTENSGHFDPITPITVTLHWSGYLDPNTQCLGRYEFDGEFLLSIPLTPLTFQFRTLLPLLPTLPLRPLLLPRPLFPILPFSLQLCMAR